ncbi:hypothetical protein BKH43_04525 [Helicobacter sp. 13S00401-1]|uniref:hypothetical protein n=1 Tax=Helicobacter sp. 13S00401-1 TaxID=1905758 RepID=UPI000BA76FDF|nr:hypothetical protein [Helicobacter sp. 13S00401-1]PAF50362.1 hypothetical protein BKH43_04525 [Helicobacter sp. 13S00401-1]
MRFILASLVINLSLLFLPFFNESKSLKGKEQELKVTISDSGLGRQDIESKSTPKSQRSQTNKVQTNKKHTHKKQTHKEHKKYKPKEVLKDSIKPKETKNIQVKEAMQLENKKAENKNVESEKIENTQALANKTSKLATLNSQALKAGYGKNGASETDMCQEDKGFKVIDAKQSYEFPRKAKMLGLKGRYKAEVSFKLNKGKIEIIKAYASNAIFKDEAIRLTKALNIKVLNDKVAKCNLIKPFIFEAR